MESPDLTAPTPPENDPLDTLFRQQARLPPLADEGFSARVLAALPAQPKTFLGLRRLDWTFVAISCGLALAVGAQSGLDPVEQLAAQLGAQARIGLNLLLDPKILLALGLTVGTLALVSLAEDSSAAGREDS